MNVKLTQAELDIAKFVGELRYNVSRQKGLKDAAGLDAKDALKIAQDISGAAGEMAFCKAKNKYWGGTVNSFHGADVDVNIQVRTTTRPNGKLIIRSADNPDHWYILVIDKSPVFEIVGYIKGAKARRPEYWNAPAGRPGAWFVPQSALDTQAVSD